MSDSYADTDIDDIVYMDSLPFGEYSEIVAKRDARKRGLSNAPVSHSPNWPQAT